MTENADIDPEALRQRAEAVRQVLVGAPLDRPLFVEFSGSPKSGKSTCIDIVSHFFRRLNYRVLAPVEGASKRTPLFLRKDLVAFNTWSASYALRHLVEGRYHSDAHDISILDRGLFDALAWFEKLSADGELSQADRDTIHQFLLIDKWRELTDVVFLFRTNPETSLDRETKDKLIDNPGRAMNPDFLNGLNTAYATVEKSYAAQFEKVVSVETSRTTNPRSTAAFVTTEILGLLERRASRA